MTDVAVVHRLSADGEIARKLPRFEVRPQQLEMARAIADAFVDKQHLIVEAGTGVGKTFAYLIPAIEHVIAHGGRAVVSTHTIALQEQLIEKDIPFLKKALNADFSAVLVKGRGNYLGLRRLERTSARQQSFFADERLQQELWRIEDWAYKTGDGSLSDLSPQPDRNLWEQVLSDTNDCKGRHCQYFKKCFYQRARRQVETAQILVVNHAMLFADLALREEGGGILPGYDFLVLDEAHTVADVAAEHMGVSLSEFQVRVLLSLLFNPRTGKGLFANINDAQLRRAVEVAHDDVVSFFHRIANWHLDRRRGDRLREPIPIEDTVTPVLSGIRDQLRERAERSQNEDDRLELRSFVKRVDSLVLRLKFLQTQQEKDWVYWMEVRGGARPRIALHGRPVDVGPILAERLFAKRSSVVLTSATLATGGNDRFAYIRGRVGLDAKTRSMELGSPFDFASQVTIRIRSDMPDPSDSQRFIPAAVNAIVEYLQMTHGHAFVLFTSYAMLNRCAEALAPTLEMLNMPMLVHGSGMPRTEMLEKFRSTPNAVLLGTSTFWAGVDVPGDALQNVIIVKLPFAAPDQPMIEARVEQLRAKGASPFMDYQVPDAVLQFKQGFGRLIRTKDDKGMVAILDPRVLSKPYGKRFLAALPECKVVIDSGPPHVDSA